MEFKFLVSMARSQGDIKDDQRHLLQIWENYSTELYDRPYRPKNLGVQTEEEVDTNKKYTYILHSEVEKAINSRRDYDVRVVGKRLFPANGITNQQRKRNWRVDQGFLWSYSYCHKEETSSYKIRRPLHDQPHCISSKDSSEDT
jgi:hypothetical protein